VASSADSGDSVFYQLEVIHLKVIQ